MSDWEERAKYQGHTVNKGILQILQVLNKLVRLEKYGGENENVHMLQGGFNKGGVKQSAGTHDGGAGDLTAHNWQNRVWLLRLLGATAYYRPKNWDGRNGIAHIHFVVQGDTSASSGARSQNSDYLKGLNGLASKRKDPNKRPLALPIYFKPYHPSNDRSLFTKHKMHAYDQPSTKGRVRETLPRGRRFQNLARVEVRNTVWVVNEKGNWARRADLGNERYPTAKAK